MLTNMVTSSSTFSPADTRPSPGCRRGAVPDGHTDAVGDGRCRRWPSDSEHEGEERVVFGTVVGSSCGFLRRDRRALTAPTECDYRKKTACGWGTRTAVPNDASGAGGWKRPKMLNHIYTIQ